MLTADNISFSRHGTTLLENISVSVQPGQIHVVLGANGAGKSTWLKLLAGDLVPTSGTIRLHDRSPAHCHPSELARQRAVLPQLGSLSFPLTVREVIELGRLPYPKATQDTHRQKIRNAMVRTGTAAFAERRYQSLSGGEQQRVQLARVLAQDTPILLLDEPVSALDMVHQFYLMQTVQTLARDGATVFMVLHDINLALRYATHISLLKNGKLVSQGETGAAITCDSLKATYGMEVSLAHSAQLGCMQAQLLYPVTPRTPVIESENTHHNAHEGSPA